MSLRTEEPHSLQALRARLQLRERECESLRGRVAGAGALTASERKQAASALEAAAAQRAVLERQLHEAQAKVGKPFDVCALIAGGRFWTLRWSCFLFLLYFYFWRKTLKKSRNCAGGGRRLRCNSSCTRRRPR